MNFILNILFCIFCKKLDLKIISIKDLVAYRMRNERLVKKEKTTRLKTGYGAFDVHAYRQIPTGDFHIALTMGNWDKDEAVLVRVESSMDSDHLLEMLFAGYGEKINQSLEMIAKEGKGALLFMQHSEKEEDVLQKIERIEAKQQGRKLPKPTLSSEMAQRDFGTGAQILRDLGINKVRAITNNPTRRIGMVGFGLELVEIVSW